MLETGKGAQAALSCVRASRPGSVESTGQWALLQKLEARLSAARGGPCSDWSSPDAMFDKAAQLVPVP